MLAITRDGEYLYAQREGVPDALRLQIVPEAPLAFFWKAVDAQSRFTTDASGMVTGAVLTQGRQIVGIKGNSGLRETKTRLRARFYRWFRVHGPQNPVRVTDRPKAVSDGRRPHRAGVVGLRRMRMSDSMLPKSRAGQFNCNRASELPDDANLRQRLGDVTRAWHPDESVPRCGFF